MVGIFVHMPDHKQTRSALTLRYLADSDETDSNMGVVGLQAAPLLFDDLSGQESSSPPEVSGLGSRTGS